MGKLTPGVHFVYLTLYPFPVFKADDSKPMVAMAQDLGCAPQSSAWMECQPRHEQCLRRWWKNSRARINITFFHLEVGLDKCRFFLPGCGLKILLLPSTFRSSRRLHERSEHSTCCLKGRDLEPSTATTQPMRLACLHERHKRCT